MLRPHRCVATCNVQELKKKELEELDAVFAELGIVTGGKEGAEQGAGESKRKRKDKKKGDAAEGGAEASASVAAGKDAAEEPSEEPASEEPEEGASGPVDPAAVRPAVALQRGGVAGMRRGGRALCLGVARLLARLTAGPSGASWAAGEGQAGGQEEGRRGPQRQEEGGAVCCGAGRSQAAAGEGEEGQPQEDVQPGAPIGSACSKAHARSHEHEHETPVLLAG
jgi:hypothetical protein